MAREFLARDFRSVLAEPTEAGASIDPRVLLEALVEEPKPFNHPETLEGENQLQ